MSVNVEKKAKILKDYQIHTEDTGSPEVQIALISSRIQELEGHFQAHPHDTHSRIGLLKMVNQRRQLLAYLKETDVDRYQKLIERLGLRK